MDDETKWKYPWFVRPKPDTFHAVTFGTCYCARGAYPGVKSSMLNNPVEHLDAWTKNAIGRREHEMIVLSDGRIIDVLDGKLIERSQRSVLWCPPTQPRPKPAARRFGDW